MKLVLLLEDNSNDLILILRALRNVVLVCPVSYRHDYIMALVENKWDLIITDLNVHTFLNFETVDIAKAKQPNIPIIVLTGSITEIDAAESIIRGATFYIMKNGFKELTEKVIEVLKI